MHKTVYLTVIGDLREHKGSSVIYCKTEPLPLCTVKVDRCADRSIFMKAYNFLNIPKLEKLTSQACRARRDLSNGIKNPKPKTVGVGVSRV